MENKVKKLKLFATKMKKKFALITGLSIAALPGCEEIQTTEVEPENTTNSIVTEQEENNTKTEIETIVEQEIEKTTKAQKEIKNNETTTIELSTQSITSSQKKDTKKHQNVESYNEKENIKETTKQPETTSSIVTEQEEKTTTTRPQTTTEPYYLQHLDSYCLEDIKTNLHAFNSYSIDLKNDLFRGQGYELSYGETYGGNEGKILLTLLNYDQLYEIDENILGIIYSSVDEEEVRTHYQIIYNIASMKKDYGITIDFTKYTLNRELGEYINSLATAADNGSITEKIYLDWYENQMPESLKNHPATIGALASYDMAYNDYTDLDQQTIDEYIMNDTVNDIIQRVCGKSYIR